MKSKPTAPKRLHEASNPHELKIPRNLPLDRTKEKEETLTTHSFSPHDREPKFHSSSKDDATSGGRWYLDFQNYMKRQEAWTVAEFKFLFLSPIQMEMAFLDLGAGKGFDAMVVKNAKDSPIADAVDRAIVAHRLRVTEVGGKQWLDRMEVIAWAAKKGYSLPGELASPEPIDTATWPTKAQAAREKRVAKSTITAAIGRGELKTVGEGQNCRVDPESLDRYQPRSFRGSR